MTEYDNTLEEYVNLYENKHRNRTQQKKLESLHKIITNSIKFTDIADREMSMLVKLRNGKYGLSLGTELKLDLLYMLRTKSMIDMGNKK